MASAFDYRTVITIEADKCGGKPCIRGQRLRVCDVLDCLASEMTMEEILADYTFLTREDILACLAFAADQVRRPIDAAILTNEIR